MSGKVSNLAANFAAFFRNYWRNLAGLGIYQILSWLYDNPLWWSVELAWDERGVAIMMIGAMLINFGILFYYRKKRVSWLCLDAGMDYLREKRLGRKILGNPKGRFAENALAFLILSIGMDSFVTTAYLRHGRNNGLKLQDVAIFFASSVVSICYWAVRNGLLVEIGFRPLLNLI